MFISDQVIFIQLHKTGCSQINRLLAELVEGDFVGQHIPATPDLFTSRRVFLGSIRNPWDWYVSLWGYGCAKKGHVYNRVTKAQGALRALGWRKTPLRAAIALVPNLLRNPDDWISCYVDVNDPAAFRRWLYRMHDRNHWNDFGEGYGQSPIRHFGGLLTYRYVSLFCRQTRALRDVMSWEELVNYEQKNCYIDYFIHNETLEDDLFQALEGAGISIPDSRKEELRGLERANVSSRKRCLDYYYDADTVRLVHEREQMIVDKFEYSPPGT